MIFSWFSSLPLQSVLQENIWPSSVTWFLIYTSVNLQKSTQFLRSHIGLYCMWAAAEIKWAPVLQGVAPGANTPDAWLGLGRHLSPTVPMAEISLPCMRAATLKWPLSAWESWTVQLTREKELREALFQFLSGVSKCVCLCLGLES